MKKSLINVLCHWTLMYSSIYYNINFILVNGGKFFFSKKQRISKNQEKMKAGLAKNKNEIIIIDSANY